MVGQLVLRNTFWELEMSPEEREFTVRPRAHTDMCAYCSIKTESSSDLGSPRSTAMGSSVGDASDRWADICDSDAEDDDSSQTSSSRSSSPPSRPQGTWFSQPVTPSRPAGTWFLPETTVGHRSSFATAGDARTTLICKNLPVGCTIDDLHRILDEVGLGGQYNFIYIPFDFKKSAFYRYGFVNFAQNEQAVKAMAALDGFYECVVEGEKGCEVDWSGQQGLSALIERYRNCPSMHTSVPAAYKPVLFENGVRVAFPAPTKAVEPPKRFATQTPEFKSEPAQPNVEAPVGQDARTTLVVKNLPAGCSHDELRRILDEVGLGGLYNFIYVPFDFKKCVALRYGFVSFEKNEQAVKASELLDGVVLDGERSCEVQWGDAQQSLHVNVERYRNSPLMHSSVPDAYKPVLFARGVRVPFPAPTKMLKPVKIRRAQQS